MKTDSLTDDMQMIRDAEQAATRVAGAEGTLRQKHTALKSERQRTFAALASRAEVHAHAERLVDEECRQFHKDHGASWVRQLSGYREIRGVDVEREVRRAPRLPELHTLISTPAMPAIQLVARAASNAPTCALAAHRRSLWLGDRVCTVVVSIFGSRRKHSGLPR